MKTVAIFSLKGGTGRTTIACNLGDQLNAQGFQTVVVDADPQNAVGLHLRHAGGRAPRPVPPRHQRA